MRTIARLVAAFSVLALCQCASNPPTRRVWVGPRIDLKAYETIGMVDFTSTSKGKLAELATRRFAEAARRDQDMVRMINVGPQNAALASVGQDAWGPAACKAIGRKQGIKTMFRGTLTISHVKPAVSLTSMFKSGQVTAQVDAALEVEMIETESGASIWSNSAAATRSVGQVSVFGGGNVSFDAADPEAAYGDLVDELVARVTRDFQGSWRTETY
jgi:hypothetical protein